MNGSAQCGRAHRIAVRIGLVAAVLAGAIHAAPPFGATTVEQAWADAKAAQKKVLVAFWGPWLEESRELRQAMEHDAALGTIVAGRTVAVEFDAANVPELARRFHPSTLPALILLDADGTEIERWTGAVSVARLRRELPAALAGRTTLQRVRADLPRALTSRFKNAQALAAQGSRAAALAELLWLYDEGLGGKLQATGFGNLSADQVVQVIHALSAHYPPAATALTERRTRLAETILARPNQTNPALKLLSIDLLRRDDASLVELWRKLPAGGARDVLGVAVVPIQVAARRYDEAARAFSSAEILTLLRERGGPHLNLAKSHVQWVVREPGASPKQMDVAYATLVFEALAGAGQDSVAREVAAYALEQGGPEIAAPVLRLAAARALGPRAEAFLAPLALPAATPAVTSTMAVAPSKPADTRRETRLEISGDNTAVASSTDEIVRMTAFVVDGRPRGVIPLAFGWTQNRITGAVTIVPVIVGLEPMEMPRGGVGALEKGFAERMAPEKHGLRAGDWLIAIDGEATHGMSGRRLRELYAEGDVGDSVVLVVKGHDADAAVHREITVKRISLKPDAVKSETAPERK